MKRRISVISIGVADLGRARRSTFGRIGYFADRDGYLWEVAYTPKWPELSE